MKTTEVFVEQVLIGLLVLLTGGMFFWDDVRKVLFTKEGDLGEKVLTSAAVIASAYLIGIIYDRFADTLLQDIEQHHRVCFALKKKEASSKKREASPDDPFPEDKLWIQVLDADSAVTTYADYLRSRIRLSRGLATLLPGLSVSFLLVCSKVNGDDEMRYGVAIALPLVYGLALLAQITKLREYRPPKTYELDDEQGEVFK